MSNRKQIDEPGISQQNSSRKRRGENVQNSPPKRERREGEIFTQVWDIFTTSVLSFLDSVCEEIVTYDNTLKLGRNNLEMILKDVINNSTHPTQADNSYDNPYELAQLTINVGIIKKAHETDDDYEKKLNLPSGWKLLTTASNVEGNNGYFGAAFVNAGKKSVVVAHQGTRNFGALVSDLAILLNAKSPRISSAVTFADHVTKALKDVPGVSLCFTGHSLGGYLAQITCFTAKYLKTHGCRFIRNPSKGIHAHTVSFDNPGCKGMLLQLQNNYKLNEECYKSLDITGYLSAPNLVNTTNHHVATKYRLLPDFHTIQLDIECPLNTVLKLLIETHSMSKIATVFSKETGTVCENRQREVAEWPNFILLQLFIRGGAMSFLAQHCSDLLSSPNTKE